MTTPATAATPTTPVASPSAHFGAATRAPAGVAWAALALAIAALGGAAWVWSDTRERNRDLRTEVSRLLANSGKEVSETRVLARNADDAVRQASERLGFLETQFAAAQQQQVAIEALYKEMAQARDNWTLAEIEPVLATAAQQLQLAGNVRAAIVALESVDTRLAQRELPQFAGLRRAIADDLAKLRATPEFDQVGVTARLDALARRAAELPLSGGETSVAAGTEAGRGEGFFRELLSELRGIVRIRRTDSSEGVLLPPAQEYFLRENLRLRLLAARIAALSREQAAYRDDLAAAGRLLAQHFDARQKSVAAVKQEIAKLAALVVAPPLPDLDASLTALANYKAAH